MPIKTFRGLLSNDQQERIRLTHKDGKTGYRIRKFELLGPDGNTNTEHVVKIYSIKQTTVTTDISFSEQTLLAAGIYNDTNDPHYLPSPSIIFDYVVFSQDIYITSKGHDNTSDLNYYIELETIHLDDGEATAVILKNFRNTNSYAT